MVCRVTWARSFTFSRVWAIRLELEGVMGFFDRRPKTAARTPTAANRSLSERRIARTADRRSFYKTLAASPDSRRIGYVEKVADSMRVVIDGDPGPLHLTVDSPVFSPDSKHTAYGATDSSRSTVTRDGVAGKQYDRIIAPLLFSPDSRHVVHIAQAGEELWAVLDGEDQGHYNDLGPASLAFSPDSRHLVYAARRGATWVGVLDGAEIEGSTDLAGDGVVLSPDSNRMAFATGDAPNVSVVMDGHRQGAYDAILDVGFVFSPDNRRVAYGARKNDSRFIVADERELKHYVNIAQHSLMFSPDGRHLAYAAALSEGSWTIVVDEEETGRYDRIGSLLFSPNSQRFIFEAAVGDEWYVVENGKPGKAYAGLATGDPGFSPDSRRLA